MNLILIIDTHQKDSQRAVSGLFPHSFQVSNLSWGAVWCCTCYFEPEAIISNLRIENPPVFIGKHGQNVAERHKTTIRKP